MSRVARSQAVKALARRLRSHPGLPGPLRKALAAAFMHPRPVRTVWRLSKIAGHDRSTLHRLFRRTALAESGVSLGMLLDAFLLIRAAELPALGRTWTGATIRLGIGEARLRRTSRYWWLEDRLAARELRAEPLIAAIEHRLGPPTGPWGTI